ncbi:MAG: molybdate ABC transporter substrate-binding protein [Sideroxydans sp.]|nr:molybdate ABC transporter substrate-binding protein [Sideroxydans sp.]
MKKIVSGLLGALLMMAQVAQAGEVRVAVAANFTAPMQEIVPLFEQASGHKVSLSFGSTGKFYAQIKQGAPYDAFVAADTKTPKKLDGDGLTVNGSRFVYALGTLVLWSAQPGVVDGKGAVLRKGDFNKLAIGDPKLAVYGTAAQETMEELGLWKILQPKLVRGDNITQTYQFAASGNAELGFIALSQITKGGKVSEGSWWIVPSHYYNPIEQSAVMLSSAQDTEATKAFLAFLKGPQAATVIRSYGYELPNK